ncbi:hypothetical protein HUN08_16095 [Gordonia sp. X0973]|uniref:hypothetical protein n=1 Tax=Gordonia sp. X0973 TaxID=2742602 RepID=UPI000F539654|nr:hypothetical protein [Gordonia sp. X0973]QKT08551.1 hypothetical protein HUN08_16095 [Gordonia sp. X0973]
MTTATWNRAHSVRIAAMGIAVAAGAAATLGGSARAAAATASDIPYTVRHVGKSAQITLGRGHFSIERGTLVVDDDAGRPRFAYPLSFVLGARSYPIDVQTIGRSATLTPVVDAARSVQLSSADGDRTDRHSPKSPKTRDGKWEIVGPQTKQQRDDQDLEQFSSEVNATMTIASIVGLAVGAVVGGAVLGLVGCAALVVLGCVPGLIPGVIVGSTLGSIAGVIIGGGGGALLYAVQYFNEVNAPFKPHYRRVPGGTRAS